MSFIASRLHVWGGAQPEPHGGGHQAPVPARSSGLLPQRRDRCDDRRCDRLHAWSAALSARPGRVEWRNHGGDPGCVDRRAAFADYVALPPPSIATSAFSRNHSPEKRRKRHESAARSVPRRIRRRATWVLPGVGQALSAT